MRPVRLIAATLAAFLLAVLALALPATATAATAPVCSPTAVVATFHTAVSADQDSGNHGDWAVDAFVRTTEIYNLCDGTYRVNVSDSGAFTTKAGALSPTAGLPLPSTPVVGKFAGTDTFLVTSETAPVLTAPAAVVGSPSTSTWPSRFFAGNNGVGGAWGWTYTTACEKWVNAASGNTGDITGKVCPTKPAPPTSTTPAPPTTVTKPAPAPVTKVVTVTNPGQFATVPNVAKGVDTGDGSLA
jgi:hypothetical protein